MAQRRVYTRQGPEPTCPEHGAMRYTLGGWRCRRMFCHYRPTDRRAVEVEADVLPLECEVEE